MLFFRWKRFARGRLEKLLWVVYQIGWPLFIVPLAWKEPNLFGGEVFGRLVKVNVFFVSGTCFHFLRKHGQNWSGLSQQPQSLHAVKANKTWRSFCSPCFLRVGHCWMWGILTVIAQCLGENHGRQLWGRATSYLFERPPENPMSKHSRIKTQVTDHLWWFLPLRFVPVKESLQCGHIMAYLPTSIVTLWCQGSWYFPSGKSLGHSASWHWDKLHLCVRTDIFG